MSTRKISVEELGKHNRPSDAWILINDQIWDVSKFAPTHPGGAEIILTYAGQDASKAYNEVHGPSLVSKHLSSSENKGKVDESTITAEWKASQKANIESSKPQSEKPPLDAILNMYDFELASQATLSAKSWAFYHTAANDLITKDANVAWWRKIWFRPRVLVGVRDVDVSATVLGQKYSVPIFSAPAALAKLSHPDGERAMAKGLTNRGTTIIACNNASFSFPEIASAIPDDHPIFYQLYFNKDRAVTERLVREVSTYKGLQAILVTVDLPVVGKRESDERIKTEATYKAPESFQSKDTAPDKKGAGLARTTGSFIDANLSWSDLPWLQSITHVPIFLKGIQSAADAKKALDYGCGGIYISNHGGRAADTAQPSLLTLLEIQRNCPEVLEAMEVFIDGGIRRGTDVLKAICLGASGVCLGRPFLFATGYGVEGVEKCVDSESLISL
jgi:L-lactate dehydrogenase (cytochrome)